MNPRLLPFCVLLVTLSSCGGASLSVSVPSATEWYQPGPLSRWQWQLTGTINTSYDVDLYDIDLFDTSKNTIRLLQQKQHKVICYFSAGSYENWRPDANDFNIKVLGKALAGWEGERWLDIRADNVRNIMLKRLDIAQEKGCDGVEPDNMDAYQNHSGFILTPKDQLEYNRFIASEAHQRKLSVALKNDLDQVKSLVDDFDFAINEQCFEFNECDKLRPFIQHNKAVLNVEYKADYVSNPTARKALCEDARKREFSTLVMPLALDDSFRFSCLSNQ